MKDFFWAWVDVLKLLAQLGGILMAVAALATFTSWHPWAGGIVDFFVATFFIALCKLEMDRD